MVGVYAYAQLTTGAYSRVVILNRDDVLAARDAGGYKANDPFSPWNRLDSGKDHPEFQGRSMWWKTGARRLEPWVPTSAEYRREQLRAAAAAGNPAGSGRVPAPGTAGPPVLHRIIPGADGVTEAVVDAEIVDDPQPPERQVTGRLADLLRLVPVGAEGDGGEAVIAAWVTGRPVSDIRELNRAEAYKVASFLDDALEAVGGDGTEAASRIWTQHAEVHARLADDELAPPPSS
jgi:hypothetical protein